VKELERARDGWVARCERLAGELAEVEPEFLRRLRREATQRFAEHGFPSPRLEDWRYTNVAALASRPFEPVPAARGAVGRADVERTAFPVFACSLFVFVNGRHAPELSTPVRDRLGLRVESLARLRRETPGVLEGRIGAHVDLAAHPFAALATALLDDGAVVTIPDGVRTSEPIHLVFASLTNGAAPLVLPRVLVSAGRSSRATLVLDHVSLGDGPCFTNAVCEAECSPDSELHLVLVQREGAGTFHVANASARQDRDSRFSSHTLSLGGSLVRNDLAVALDAEGAEATLQGLFVGTGEQVLDNHTLVDHARPHGTSRELYKGILGGSARGVFRGRIVVREGAQKTDARQSNANVLLGDGAEIDTKPQLEIRADDVKCSHGSSIGALDEEALFYLRSRGIAEPHARDVLTRGFAAEILQALPVAGLGECVADLVLERLHRRLEAA
jgi:Fe-S cluster assembly protein SufD